MTKTQATKFINALRSGEYQQTRNTLQNSIGYCCLGVACKIFISPKKQLVDLSGRLLGKMPSFQTNAPIWLNVNKLNGVMLTEYLTDLNDNWELTFDEIADVIQAVYVLGVLK